MVPSIKINDTSYEIDGLRDEAKARLQMLQATDQEITHLQTRLANALQGLLPRSEGAGKSQ